MQGSLSIFYFLILIFSIIVHEVAHGLMAEREGDTTARRLGRITLNPIKHIDWFGSIILPAILILTNAGMVVGWAKPVPYNPDNLKRGNKSVALVSIAGIIVNLGIAIVFGLLIRILLSTGTGTSAIVEIASIIVLLNIVLALFNAIPLAPLDGFRFLSAVLPYRAQPTMQVIERYSLPLLIVFIFFGWRFVSPLALNLYSLLTGIAL
jgi:Zn-dependent protease